MNMKLHDKGVKSEAFTGSHGSRVAPRPTAALYSAPKPC
jgi:hypothetical protein